MGTKYYVFELTTGRLAEGFLADGYPSEAEALLAIEEALLRATAGVYCVLMGHQQSMLESVELQQLELQMLEEGGGLIFGVDTPSLSI